MFKTENEIRSKELGVMSKNNSWIAVYSSLLTFIVLFKNIV